MAGRNPAIGSENVGEVDRARLELLHRCLTGGVEFHLDPVHALQPLGPVGALSEFGRAAEGELLVEFSEVADAGKIVLVGELPGHRHRILVTGLRLIEHGEVVRERLLELFVHVLFRACLGVRIIELQEVAGVFREDRDVPGLDRGHVRVALTDGELPLHVKPGVLQRLGVDLRDDLVRVVALRHHRHRTGLLGLRTTGIVGFGIERVGSRAGREHQRRGPEGGKMTNSHYFSLLLAVVATDWDKPLGRTPRWARANTPSRTSARAVTSSAPPRTMSNLRSGMPAMMYCPSPPKPTYAPIVTVAMTCSTAERIPATSSGILSGTSVRMRICHSVIPIAREESTTSRGTAATPE